MIQQLIDQHLSAITAQIRAKYPSEMESYAKRLINLGMDADQVEEDMQAVLRTLVMRNESVSDEEFFYILNLFPDYEQFGKQTIEFKITLEGTKSWRKVRAGNSQFNGAGLCSDCSFSWNGRAFVYA